MVWVKVIMTSLSSHGAYIITQILTLSAPTPQNGQIHSNNSSAVADELFDCV